MIRGIAIFLSSVVTGLIVLALSQVIFAHFGFDRGAPVLGSWFKVHDFCLAIAVLTSALVNNRLQANWPKASAVGEGSPDAPLPSYKGSTRSFIPSWLRIWG